MARAPKRPPARKKAAAARKPSAPPPAAEPPRKLGRPSKLTEEVQQRIAQAIQLGATYALAARYGGIAQSTFHAWMVEGEREVPPDAPPDVLPPEPQFVAFAEAVRAAEAKGTIQWLAQIEKAAPKDWKAAAWKLERRYPNEYGRTVHDHNINPRDALAALLGVSPTELPPG